MSFKFKPIHALGIVVLLAILAAGYVLVSKASLPVVAVGDTIQVNYTGSFTNGTVFGSSAGGQPLNFTVGAGQLIPGFDQAVVGMKLHQRKTVTIPVDQAYGPVNPSLIIQVARSQFGNQTVQVGMTVTQTAQNGQQAQGIITAVNATNVTVDFNSPLAGQTLVFNITVVGIQKKS